MNDDLWLEIASGLRAGEDYLLNNGVENASKYINLVSKKLQHFYAKYGLSKKALLLGKVPGQVYIYTHHFTSCDIHFAFNISYFERFDLRREACTLSLSEFCAPDAEQGRFMYSPCPDMRTTYKFNAEPIIGVPFHLVRGKSILVIDGNHRITQAIALGNKDILACGVAHTECTNFLAGRFECALYIMLEEINILINEVQNEPIDLSRSFFLGL